MGVTLGVPSKLKYKYSNFRYLGSKFISKISELM
jgi:hypothetical protein